MMWFHHLIIYLHIHSHNLLIFVHQCYNVMLNHNSLKISKSSLNVRRPPFVNYACLGFEFVSACLCLCKLPVQV